MAKKFIITLSILIVSLVLIGFVLPSNTEVSRSIVIHRDVNSVFQMVNNYHEFSKWSPWARKDAATQYTFTGPYTGVGAKMSWHSENSQVGSGSQEIIESIPSKKVAVKLEFDGQGSANAYYLIDAVDSTETLLTWGFKTEHRMNIISRYFGLMLDSWVGADYEEGLNNLKMLLET